MPPHRQAFAPGDVRLRRLSVGFVCRQGMLEQTFGWCRPAGGAEHVYEARSATGTFLHLAESTRSETALELRPTVAPCG